MGEGKLHVKLHTCTLQLVCHLSFESHTYSHTLCALQHITVLQYIYSIIIFMRNIYTCTILFFITAELPTGKQVITLTL